MPVAHGTLAYREAGTGVALVLLHGIGSGAASWEAQFDELADRYRVIAWDAPGYGDSSPLPLPTPLAPDYAAALVQFLARLHVDELVLVGHSLGAMVAAAWAAEPTARLHALVLASPARGYASAPADVRQAKWQERIEAIERLGPQAMAAERSSKLCSPGATATVVEKVRASMARVTRQGYGQAAHMLVHDDLLSHLRRVKAPVTVLCGELDTVTPPDACAGIAQVVGAPFVSLPGLGHACYVEGPALFNSALTLALARARRP